MSFQLFGDVKSTDGRIRFDHNSDGSAEMTLNSTGLGIGVIPSANLEVSGNAIISNQLIVGGDSGEASLSLQGTMALIPSIVSTNTVLAGNSLVLVNPSTANGNITITLPTSASVNGRIYKIKSISEDHGLTVVPQGGELIDQHSFIGFSDNQTILPSLEVISSGDKWYILGQSGEDDETFIPTSIANLQMWLDGDDTQTLYSSYPSTLAGNGDSIERWVDKSGQGNDAVQMVSAQQPTRLTVSYNDEYRSTVYMGDGVGMLTSCDISSAPYTIFCVYNRKFANSENSRAIQGQVNNWLLGPYNYGHRHYAGGWVTNAGAEPLTYLEYGIATAKNDGSDSTFYLNGVDDTDSSTPVSAPGVIAMGNAGLYNQPLKGDLSEVIVYDRALADEELDSIHGYLLKKWSSAALETDSGDPDLICWLDASDNTTIYSSYPSTLAGNGDAVTFWEDKSGYGHHASDATNVNYYTNVQNGENVVRLGGSDGDGMVIEDNFFLTEYTIFIVFNTRSAVSTARRALAGISNNWLIGPYSGSIRNYAIDHWVSSGNVAVSAGTFYMGVAASDSSSHEFYIDGSDETDDNSPITILINLAFGAKGLYSTEPLDGDIAELRVYNYKMSDGDRQTIEAELTTKWGL
jgi:hypothetical protein